MEVKRMTKRTPWWRKPFDKDDEYDEKEDEKEKSKRDRRRPYGRRHEDWLPRRDRFFESPFEDEFDQFLSRSPFKYRDEFFGDIEREFEGMHMRMDKIFKQSMDGKLEKPGPGGPYVYGFSMRTGPDGVPHFQEFGNVGPEMMRRLRAPEALPLTGSGEACAPCNTGEIPSKMDASETLRREPLTDIMEQDRKICITMELPGIEKKDIDLNMEDGELIVKVDAPERQYYKKLPLPAEVNPKTISANYKNGVLDVTINRLKPELKKSKRIKID
jgi:HSP20 family protein